MPPYDDEAPGNKELYRILCDFRDEWRTSMGQLVRRDLYDVQREALGSRLLKLENEREAQVKQQASQRNQVYFAVFGAGLSFATALLVAAVK
jgi:hypothetical protein